MLAFICCMLLCIGILQDAGAAPPWTQQEHRSRATVRDSTGADRPRLRWTVLPIFFSSPDTRLGVGAMPTLVYRTVRGTRASSIKLESTYTQNRQFNLRVSSSIWSPLNRYGFESRIQFQRWPTSFYGIGNDAGRSQREAYRERIILATTEVHRLAAPNLYVGMRHDVRYGVLDDFAPDGRLATGEVIGSEGGSIIGLGTSVSYDTRDAVLYPTRGVHVRLGTRFFTPLFGSDYAFARHRLEARMYHALPRAQVLAGQLVGAFASGEPPFQMMSSVGELLRGYGANRYVDRHLVAARIEYRFTPIVWRFGIALFAGAAQVANNFEDFRANLFHYSAGVGVRFQVIPSENVNLRLDFAFAGGSSGSYLDLGEAF